MIDKFVQFASAALLCGAMAGGAQAQEVYSSGNPNNSDTYNGGNTSNRTGTQGVVGNPFCAPPHEIINGKDVTPLNWSCPTVQQPYVIPHNMTVAHPGPAYVPGAANPCQPGGPGSYNWLDNPVGTRLPPGCVRPTGKTITTAKTDAHYETSPPGSYIVPPVGPPGSYIQPDGRPGSYIVPRYGAPGSYINSTAKGTQVHTGPGGAIVLSPGKNESADEEPGRQDAQSMPGGGSGNGATANFEPGNAVPYRQDTGPMRGGVASNGGASPYRQDSGAMQPGGNSGGGFSLGAPGQAIKTTAPKQPSTAAANAAANSQAAKLVNRIINLFGNGP